MTEFCQVLFRVNSQNSQQEHTTKKVARFHKHFPHSINCGQGDHCTCRAEKGHWFDWVHVLGVLTNNVNMAMLNNQQTTHFLFLGLFLMKFNRFFTQNLCL